MWSLPEKNTFGISDQDPFYQDFLTYYEEAQFALKLFEHKIKALSKDANILEIGSGIGLLSNQIANLGFRNITCVEPDAKGFGNMWRIAKYVEAHPRYKSNNLTNFHDVIEKLDTLKKFDFVFSFNVMEHVSQPSLVLRHIYQLLSPEGEYYFVCPNYVFPYEGHFNIPIVINKKITKIIFNKKIRLLKANEPLCLWESLNWINPFLIKKSLPPDSQIAFRKEATNLYFSRLNSDPSFNLRKGVLVKFIALALRPLITLLPTQLKPVIECSIRKK